MRHTSWILLIGMSLLPLTGCGTGGASETLDVRPRPTQLPPGSTPKLQLPTETSFSIAEQRIVREIPAGGTADCVAEAKGSGDAIATARASDGANAASVFQLGHAVVNPSDQAISISLTVGFDFQFSLSAEPDRGFPDAKVSMDIVVHRRQPRSSRTHTLFTLSTEDGTTESGGRDERTITFIMTPRSTYDIFVAGEVISESKLGRSSGAELRISNVSIVLDGVVAPAVSANPVSITNESADG